MSKKNKKEIEPKCPYFKRTDELFGAGGDRVKLIREDYCKKMMKECFCNGHMNRCQAVEEED